jgi:hypothetical protein
MVAQCDSDSREKCWCDITDIFSFWQKATEANIFGRLSLIIGNWDVASAQTPDP